MPFPRDHKYTAEEFFKLTPENESERYELINGEIFAQSAPSAIHQTLVMRISSKIDNFIMSNKGKCKVLISPFDVVLDDENLIIEVTSSNYGRDYIDKLDIYRKSGVREYWIVDPLYERVMVYFFEMSNSPNIYTFDSEVPVGIYDGKLTICVKDLL